MRHLAHKMVATITLPKKVHNLRFYPKFSDSIFDILLLFKGRKLKISQKQVGGMDQFYKKKLQNST